MSLYVCILFFCCNSSSIECIQNPHNMRHSTWLTALTQLAANLITSRCCWYCCCCTHSKWKQQHKIVVVFLSFFFHLSNNDKLRIEKLKFNRFENRVWEFFFLREVSIFVRVFFLCSVPNQRKKTSIIINLNLWHFNVRLKYHRNHTSTYTHITQYVWVTTRINVSLSVSRTFKHVYVAFVFTHRDSIFFSLQNLVDSCWGETAWP